MSTTPQPNELKFKDSCEPSRLNKIKLIAPQLGSRALLFSQQSINTFTGLITLVSESGKSTISDSLRLVANGISRLSDEYIKNEYDIFDKDDKPDSDGYLSD